MSQSVYYSSMSPSCILTIDKKAADVTLGSATSTLQPDSVTWKSHVFTHSLGYKATTS